MLSRTTNYTMMCPAREQTQTAKAGPVLLIDDDAAMRQMLAKYFDEQHVQVSAAASQAELKRHLDATDPGLILLGLGLGQTCRGLDLVRNIRQCSDVPIIVVCHQHGQGDRIEALELGADDYIAEPFNLRELVARVRAVLRRQRMGAVAERRGSNRSGFLFGGWRLDGRSRELIDPHGEAVELRKGEYVLLRAFLETPQQVLAREDLLRATRIHQDVLDRSIDVQIMRLRRKLNTTGSLPGAIQTYRGAGYMFTLRVERF